MSNQSQPWSKMRRQRLKSVTLILFKSYYQFLFDGRHLESGVINVGQRQHCHIHLDRCRKYCGSCWNYVCMSLETDVTPVSRKPPIFSRTMHMVFNVSPGMKKSYAHAGNAKTSKIDL